MNKNGCDIVDFMILFCIHKCIKSNLQVMAKENEIIDEIKDTGGITKPTEPAVEPEVAAPVGDETVPEGDVPAQEDISEIIGVLNEFQKMIGGKGDITDVPENLRGVLKLSIETLIGIRDLYEDPLYKQLLEDLSDQKEDGKTPSVKVAIARIVPLEELQNIADEENYEDIQGAVDERLSSDKEAQDNEASLAASFAESQKSGKTYCEKMGYDDEETNRLFTTAMDWFKILGDGKISEDEWARIDKMDNYDSDTQALRGQIPKEQTKEVLPDNSSIQQMQNAKPAEKAPAKPTNSIEAMSAAMSGTPSYLKPRGSGSARR